MPAQTTTTQDNRDLPHRASVVSNSRANNSGTSVVWGAAAKQVGVGVRYARTALINRVRLCVGAPVALGQI